MVLPARRRDREPRDRGELTALGSSNRTSLFSSPPVSDDDSDEEALLSQPTMAERIISMSQGSANGSVELPKKKPNATPTKREPEPPASSKRPQPNRRRKPTEPVLPTRSSARLRGRSKVMYVPEDEEAEANSDDDFQSPDHRSSVRPSTRKKSKKKRARSSPKSKARAASGDESDSLGVIDFGTPIRKRPRKEKIPDAVQWEINRAMLSQEDVLLAGRIFRDVYKAPPNNQRAAARFRQLFGRDPTDAEAKELWEKVYEPWSEQWYRLHEKFVDDCRERKKNKPKDRDPALRTREVKRWFETFHKASGDIVVPELPEKYQKKPPETKRSPKKTKKQPTKHTRATRKSSRVANAVAKNEIVTAIEDQDDAEMKDEPVFIVKSNKSPKKAKIEQQTAKESGAAEVAIVKSQETPEPPVTDSPVVDSAEQPANVLDSQARTDASLTIEGNVHEESAPSPKKILTSDDGSIAPHKPKCKGKLSLVRLNVGFSIPQNSKPKDVDLAEKPVESPVTGTNEKGDVNTNCNLETAAGEVPVGSHEFIGSILEGMVDRIYVAKGLVVAEVEANNALVDDAAPPESLPTIVVSDRSSDDSDAEPTMLPGRRRSRPRPTYNSTRS